MKMKNLKSLAESRKIKYGTLNLIFIAIVVAIVIMLNSIITVLSGAKGWYLDMTEEQLYTVSDELITLLDTVSQDMEIDIIFCCDKDEAEGNFTDADTGTGSALSYIHSTAIQIAERLDNVSVEYVDPIKDYEFMKKFNTVSTQINPSESTIIIARKDANGEYGTMYRVYHATSFYTFASQVDGTNQLYGYSGERTFASAILSLTHDKTPTVYFVAGHSETVPYSTADGDYNVPSIAKVFLDCGFRARYIFLGDDEKQFTCTKPGCGDTWGKREVEKTETFVCSCDTVYETKRVKFEEERTIPEDARAIIINDPKGDYGANELSKLSKYLISQRGTIMCFTDPTSGYQLDNLYKFIKQETGVTVVDGDVVKDGGSVSINGIYDFRGDIASNAAASTYLGALQDFGAKEPIINNSGILKIDPKYTGDSTVSDVLADRVTQPLIQTDSSATFKGNEGKYNVLTVTALTTIYENEHVQSYFVVAPNTSFAGDDYMSNVIYPNEDIVMALIHSTTAVNVPVDLDFKTFANYQLDITSSQASTVFICLVTIMPALVVAIGIFVIVRRKHR